MAYAWRYLNRGTCPICHGARRDCRENTHTNLIHCRHDAGDSPGYKCVGEDKWGFFMWAVDDGCDTTVSEWETQRLQRAAEREKRLREEAEHYAQLLSLEERDRQIRKLSGQLSLSSSDRKHLREERGLTDSAIDHACYFTIEPFQEVVGISPKLAGVDLWGRKLTIGQRGIGCCVFDVYGRIIGWQTRFDDATENKYKWPTSRSVRRPNGPTAHLQNGELPIAVWRKRGGVKRRSIGMSEGVNPKPYIVAQRLGQPVLGAAGGNFASSPQQVKESLDVLSAEIGSKIIDFYVDAGACLNPHVVKQYSRSWELLRSLGYTEIRIPWWNQISQDSPDPDELPDHLLPTDNADFFYITPEKFLEIAQKQQYEKAKRDEFKRLSSLSLQPNVLLQQRHLGNTQCPQKGLVFVRSPKNSGKTNWSKGVVDWFKSQGLPIISLVPRRILGREQCEKLEMDYIDDLTVLTGSGYIDNDLTTMMLERSLGLGLCVDSLWRISLQQWAGGLLLVDELEQVLEHLSTSDTCEERRGLLMLRLAELICFIIETGGMVLGMDADLTDVSVNYLRDLAPANTPYYIIRNNHNPDPWNVTFLSADNKAAIYPAILDAIDESTRDEIIVIATDSQRECQALDEWLVEQRPDIKVLRVDRLTAEEHFIKDFVRRPNSGLLALKPKVLVYSPTMATGVSIEVDNIKCVFGLFFGATTDKGAAQMLGRVRKPVPRIVWAKALAQDKDICTSPFETEVQKKLMDFHYRTANRVLNLAAAIASGEDAIDLLNALNLLFDRENGATACPHVRLWCRIQARRNGSLAHLAENIKNTLIADGHDIDYSVLKEDNDAFNAISGIKKQVDQETANKMATSPDIPIAEAKRIMNSERSTESDRIPARKAFLKERLPGVELSPEFIYKAAIEDGGIWLKRQWLYWLLLHPEVCFGLDIKTWKHHLGRVNPYLPDIHTSSLQVNVLRRLGIHQLLDLSREFSADDPAVLKLHALALEWENRRDLKVALGITVTHDTEPMSLVGRIFKKLGVSVCCVRREGPKENQKRFYRIKGEVWNDPDRLAVLAAFDQRYADLMQQPEPERAVAIAAAFFDTQTTEKAATTADEHMSAQTVKPVPEGVGSQNSLFNINHANSDYQRTLFESKTSTHTEHNELQFTQDNPEATRRAYSFSVGDIVLRLTDSARFRIQKIVGHIAWCKWLNAFVPLVDIPVNFWELEPET